MEGSNRNINFAGQMCHLVENLRSSSIGQKQGVIFKFNLKITPEIFRALE